MSESLTVAQSIQQLIVRKGPSIGLRVTIQELRALGHHPTNIGLAAGAMNCLAKKGGFEGYEVVKLPEPDIKIEYMLALRGRLTTEGFSPCGDCKIGKRAIIKPRNKQLCFILEDICSKD